jgi:heme/copper-type cytochrome/quinol oxidase subunit 3
MTPLPRPTEPVADVSSLPTVVFGHREIIWWGTIGFMVVEGMTLVVTLSSWFYLWRNFDRWPPPGIQYPDLVLGTLSLLVLLVTSLPYYLADRAAKRLDAAATRRWLWSGAATTTLATVFRFLEFDGLGTTFDASAYGSVVWAILVTHLTLLIVDVLETAVAAMVFTRRKQEPKHFVDASDNAFYSYFLIIAWIPAYAVVYLLPRWM